MTKNRIHFCKNFSDWLYSSFATESYTGLVNWTRRFGDVIQVSADYYSLLHLRPFIVSKCILLNLQLDLFLVFTVYVLAFYALINPKFCRFYLYETMNCLYRRWIWEQKHLVIMYFHKKKLLPTHNDRLETKSGIYPIISSSKFYFN